MKTYLKCLNWCSGRIVVASKVEISTVRQKVGERRLAEAVDEVFAGSEEGNGVGGAVKEYGGGAARAMAVDGVRCRRDFDLWRLPTDFWERTKIL